MPSHHIGSLSNTSPASDLSQLAQADTIRRGMLVKMANGPIHVVGNTAKYTMGLGQKGSDSGSSAIGYGGEYLSRKVPLHSTKSQSKVRVSSPGLACSPLHEGGGTLSPTSSCSTFETNLEFIVSSAS